MNKVLILPNVTMNDEKLYACYEYTLSQLNRFILLLLQGGPAREINNMEKYRSLTSMWNAYAEQQSMFFWTCLSGSGGRMLDSFAW